MKMLIGKKKIEAVNSPISGYLPIYREIYAIEWCLAASYAACKRIENKLINNN
jgi:hypothetical protein